MIEVRDVREFMEKFAADLPPFEQTIKSPKHDDGTQYPGHERVAYSQGFPKVKISQKIKTRGDGEKEYEPIEKNYVLHKDPPLEGPNMAWRRSVANLQTKTPPQQNSAPRVSDSQNYQLVKKWMNGRNNTQQVSAASIAGLGR
jgi:hypothetical protein